MTLCGRGMDIFWNQTFGLFSLNLSVHSCAQQQHRMQGTQPNKVLTPYLRVLHTELL